MIDNDLDLLRQELDRLELQAPQRPLITDEDVRRVMQSPRPRRRVWLVPAGIAASVALVMGMGIRVIHKECELPSMPQTMEVAQEETPQLEDRLSSLSQPARTGNQVVASSSHSASPRGQAVSPSSQTLEIVQIDDEATFRDCVEAQIIQAASLINV
mgnify:CR=1 FL=1